MDLFYDVEVKVGDAGEAEAPGGRSENRDWREAALLDLIEEIRLIVEASIDNHISAVIIRSLPVDSTTMRSIRDLTAVSRVDDDTYLTIHTGIIELERLIQTISTMFLPRAKELLGVSCLRAEQIDLDREVRILRKMLIYALPANLCRLGELVEQLKGMLSFVFAA
jgi:hypothetical protein